MVDGILEDAAIMMPGIVDQSVSSFENGLILVKVSM